MPTEAQLPRATFADAASERETLRKHPSKSLTYWLAPTAASLLFATALVGLQQWMRRDEPARTMKDTVAARVMSSAAWGWLGLGAVVLGLAMVGVTFVVYRRHQQEWDTWERALPRDERVMLQQLQKDKAFPEPFYSRISVG